MTDHAAYNDEGSDPNSDIKKQNLSETTLGDIADAASERGKTKTQDLGKTDDPSVGPNEGHD